MKMSVGKALVEGQPVVFTGEGRLPEVVCEEGKEKEALELMVKMELITLTRPVRESVPE
jgi:hypothetical protein